MSAGARAAASEPAAVRLEVEAGSCIDETALAARLSQRGIEVTTATDALAARVRAWPTSAGFEGTFSVTSPVGAPSTSRTLDARSCDDLAEALSFALALALERRTDEPPPPTERPIVDNPPPPPPVAPPSPPPRVRLGVALDGTGAVGLAPSPAIGAGAFGEAVLLGGALSPSLRAGFQAIAPTSDAAAGHELRMALQVGSLEVCPTRWTASRATFVPCARVRVGRLQASGRGFVGARLDNELWADLDLVTRVVLRVAAPLDAEADVAAIFPLRRMTYSFGDTDVYTPAAVGGQFSAGLTAHFP
jgi:hypothetical protein